MSPEPMVERLAPRISVSLNNLTIVGTWCYRVYDWQRIGALIHRGVSPVERIVTAQIAMDATVPEGFDVLIDPDGSAIKILVGVS